mgnify:CR=1 FL=1
MKVNIRIETEQSCTVRTVLVVLRQTPERDSILLTLNIDTQTAAPVISHEQAINNPHTLIAEFEQRQALSLDSHRESALQKRHTKGYLSARENLANLCDPGTFQEKKGKKETGTLYIKGRAPNAY